MSSQQINAVEFKDFINGSHTPDGSHGLFKFAADQGEFTIALPTAALPKLMAVISNVAAKNAQLQTGNKQKHAVPCTIWDFAPDPGGESVNMTFRMPGGMEMTFQISKTQIPIMKDALSAAETGDSVIPIVGRI